MAYFKNFPHTTYELGGVESIVKDIFRRSMFISEYTPYSDIFMKYSITDGETPQSVAKDFYGSVDYYWVILIFNEIHNPYFDWPMSQLELELYTKSKYGSALYSTKQYEVDGVIVGQIKEFKSGDTWIAPENIGFGTAVSFYDYENMENEKRRDIHLLRPELLSDFIKQFESSINE